MKIKTLLCVAFVLVMVFFTNLAGPVYALPSLQLGPGGTLEDWVYDPFTETWVVDSGSFSLNAYANAEDGKGAFAWESEFADALTAYLVVAGTPHINFDGFDVTISNDRGMLSLLDSGFGTPPVADHNSLAPHGIFDTWFEIYQFQFDGATLNIPNTQPVELGGDGGTGPGYIETFDVTINALAANVAGVHFDLFTLTDDGSYSIDGGIVNVNRFAPFSHDAETSSVPEPTTILLFGSSLIGIAGFRRRFRKK